MRVLGFDEVVRVSGGSSGGSRFSLYNVGHTIGRAIGSLQFNSAPSGMVTPTGDELQRQISEARLNDSTGKI
jgi:hypothetical protein